MRGSLLGLLTLFLCGFCMADEGKYVMVTEEWAPYNYVDNGSLRGLSVEIVEAIMASTNVRFRAMILPTMRTTWALNQEPRTIMFSLFRTQEREKLYKWVGPIVEEGIFPYRLRERGLIPRSLEDLKGKARITTRSAGLIPRRLQALGFSNLEMVANESEQLYKMLFEKRTEIIVGDTDLGVKYYTRKLGYGYSELERIPVEIFRAELYIAFSLDSDDNLVASWNEALQRLRKDGTIAQIIAKYR